MSDTVLMALFRQQAQRLNGAIMPHWSLWQAGDASALKPLCHAVHLLKGAALTVSAEALAQALHALENALQQVRQTEALRCWPDVLAAWQPWLAEAHAANTETPQLMPALGPDSLRRALREGFAAQVRLSGQPATLHLQLDPCWSVDEDPVCSTLLWVIWPQLLRNALVHGGESAAVRVAAGKPERLQVRLRLRRRGGHFSLVLADDGRGKARPAQSPDLMSGRGWGVAAVRAVVADLPSGCLAFRCRVGVGSIVRITWGH